ncbi:MAG: DUF5011 domain-containing protein [Bacteroidales bacterium]|nr:DUF5011 domain-containing protein [Bacteroidales bacterium]
MKKFLTYHILLLFILVTGCEKWYTTEDVSHISYIPEFILEGGEFISIIRNDSMEFEDPGAEAFSNGEPLHVYSAGEVDVSEVGVYTIVYAAQNSDGLIGAAERVVAVTHHDVTNVDVEGTYIGTVWDPVQARVKKIDEKGLYECDEVMGFPGAEMRGRFVILGNHELVLLHGEGYFGTYAASEGEYTLSTLSWTIFLTEEPYEGIDIPVIWTKID